MRDFRTAHLLYILTVLNIMLITLNDIARKAGVSVSTVSRVLNRQSQKNRISSKTEKLVLKAAKDLNYRPNQLARGLRLKKTHTIGLVVPDISNPFFAHVTRMIQKNANDFGYSMIVCNTDENIETEREQIELLRGKGVDGYIIMPVGVENDHIVELIEFDKPLVLLDRCFNDLETNSIVVNNFGGSYQATKYLIEQGHTRIAIIQGLINTSTNSERVKGYKEALKEFGVPVDSKLIVGNDFRKDNGYIETKLLLSTSNPPSAIFTMSDLITLGALEAIEESDFAIPEDISIISYDDIDFAPFFKSPLTAVRQPKESMGKLAVKLLIEDIKSKSKNVKQKIVLKPELVIRKSVKNLKSGFSHN
jgi:LacI family transcriptional regulator